MAKQTINIGAAANDGTGDPIRTAFGKVNDNFTEVYTANTGVNTGDETLASIKSKLGITTLSGSNTGDQNLAAYATTAAVAAGYQPLDSDLTAIAALTTTAYGRALLSTADAPTLRTAIGLGQTDAPTFLAQTLTGQSLTGTQATSLVDLATTWNTTGNPSLIYGRVTNTNSGTTANLIDLGTFAGGSLFKVNKAGGIRSIPSDNSSPAIGGILGTNIGAATVALYFGYTQAGSVHAYLDDAAFILRSTSYFGFSSNQPGIQSADTTLFRDAAGILAQRNGVLAQAFRAYNTFTDPSNKEWGEFDWRTTTNTLRIGTNHIGTGQARPIDFVVGGAVKMSISAAGDITPFADNSGSVGTNALRFASVRTNFVACSSIGVYSALGGLLLVDGSGSNFGRLQLGGTTSSFPAIKRNGTGIDIRLADDSGFAPLSASNVVASGYFSTSGYCIVGSSNGYFWPSKGGMYAPSDGVIRLSNDSVSGFTRLELGTANLGISRGTGSPEGVVTALVGSLYLRTDGGAATTLYVKESSPTPSTGWVAK